jgi:hypothetical protein
MENTKNSNPKINLHNWQILSGNAIKVLGLLLMVMDHLHQMFIAQGAPEWLNWFGRPVATMFIFLCAEGFYHTRNRVVYMLRLLAGFLFMAAVNRALSHFMYLEHIQLINNIFSTLFIITFYMLMIDLIRRGAAEKKAAKILLAAGGMLVPLVIGAALLLAVSAENRTAALILLFIPNPITAEGGFSLVIMGILFYVLRRFRLIQAGLVLAISALSWYTLKDSQWLMAAAVIPMLLYSGKRGGGNKYIFYIFYPAHIYLFYLIAWFLR